jgi:hypothetical protein
MESPIDPSIINDTNQDEEKNKRKPGRDHNYKCDDNPREDGQPNKFLVRTQGGDGKNIFSIDNESLDYEDEVKKGISDNTRDKIQIIKKAGTGKDKTGYISQIGDPKFPCRAGRLEDPCQSPISKEMLRKMLAKLEPDSKRKNRQREVYIMHHLGFTNQEIATALHITKSQVQNACDNAKKNLREIWKAEKESEKELEEKFFTMKNGKWTKVGDLLCRG